MTELTVDSLSGGAGDARWRPAAVHPTVVQTARLFFDNRLSQAVGALLGLEQWSATLGDPVAKADSAGTMSAWMEPALLELAHPAGRLRVALDLARYPMLGSVAGNDPIAPSRSHGDNALRLAVTNILVEPVLQTFATLGLKDLKLADLYRTTPASIGQSPVAAEIPAVYVTFTRHGRVHTVMVMLDVPLLLQLQHLLDQHYAAMPLPARTAHPYLPTNIMLPGRLIIGNKTLSVATLDGLATGDVILRAASKDAFTLVPGRRNGPIRTTVAWGTPGLTRVHAQAEIDGWTLSISKDPYMTEDIDTSGSDEALTADTRDEAINVGELELPIQLEVDTIALPLSDIYALRAGYVLELPSPAQAAQVKLVTHGRTIGYAELVSVGEHLGVRILRMVQGNVPAQ